MAGRKKKIYDDDDGRTIADMSGVSGNNMFIPRRSQREGSQDVQETQTESSGKDRPWESQDMLTKEERKWYILGALKAALLIGSAFILGFGAAILILILIWG